MPTFYADVLICATAYVTAETEEEARALFAEHFGVQRPLPGGGYEPLEGIDLAARDIPLTEDESVVLSPAVTSFGVESLDLIEEA